jgi:hypothetical protein
MIGAGLSRWTMSYFAAALTWFLAALTMMVAGVGFPAADIAAPDTLILVHAICIGWLSLAMCGALFQFVPVLVGKPLVSEKWALPALGLLNAGLLFLVAGFLCLDGRPAGLPFLPMGATLLAAGFGMVIISLGLTAWTRPAGPALFVLAGLASLAANVSLGAIFAFALVGWGGSTAQLLVADGIPLHAIAGLGGWLSLTAMGVSYRLLAMFMLSPDVADLQSRVTLAAGALAIAITVAGGTLAIGLALGLRVVLSVAAALGFACAALYGRDVVGLFRARKRQQLELNMQMAKLSFASLAATTLLGASLAIADAFTKHIGAFTFLAAFGWLSGLSLAKLYKIVAFLTWLESYGPVMGRAPTPRVQDLVVEPEALKWFVAYYVAVWCGTLMLLIGQPTAFRGTAALMSVAVIGIARELIRTRRLANVTASLRFSGGARVPHLLFAQN